MMCLNHLLFVSDTEKVYQADLVLLAMGFLGPEKTVLDELALEKDPRSNVKTPSSKYSTSVSRVYAAGGKFALSIWNFHFIMSV